MNVDEFEMLTEFSIHLSKKLKKKTITSKRSIPSPLQKLLNILPLNIFQYHNPRATFVRYNIGRLSNFTHTLKY